MAQRDIQDRRQMFNEAESLSKEMSASTNLHRHELFPGYVNSKPMSLLKSSNISRSLEGCTGTNQRHYISSSVNMINAYVE